ncbi:MAG TPA: hypothetical protein VJQ52_21230 [Steroidobacteraceae bacterium]|nr:hypothetical protein [Steroidobacteraceae bacterium]
MTHSDYNGPLGAHGECWNLLPWIANESAAPKDVARVETHLRDCRECQQELEFQRQLRNAIRSEEAIVLAPQTSLQKLMQRIDTVAEIDDDERDAPREPRPAPRRRMSWLAIAAAAQGIAITGLLAALWSQSTGTLTTPRFTTLTNETAVARGPVIRVVFADSIALDDMNQLLRRIDAQVIAGPSEAGVYTLGLAAGSAEKADVDKALVQLRADKRVRFAEPALAREAP